ncbi:hypothetical protein C0Q70_09967 [Pomacea canaliculata]|uniref:Uncharacterized protein n=1 Tax=Pomacea canaliculata TaxID=400727 RepID=A0A2T7PB97_POMCA|nr:hypothetical protein C0Q70_09967 [Pomacea canaliculata]
MATNQGVVAEEERLHDLFVGDCGDGPAHESSEQSNIKESSTPPDLIVQRQLRDVTFQESFMKENLVSKEEHVMKIQEFEHALQEKYVPREEYDSVLQQLENEQQLHAKTKLKLLEVTDRLDFTLEELEILNRQMMKEKESFQQMVDSMRSQIAKGKNWNEELETKYAALQQRCQELEGRLTSRETTIEILEAQLQKQQKQCERKIEEIEVERQQDQYVARMLDQPSRGRSKVCCSSKVTCGHKLKR